MVNRTDYTKEAVEAAHAVLLELHRVLGEYSDEIAVIGGWVPQLLLPGDHMGSTDVDLALNHRSLDEVGYKAIKECLLASGYRESEKQPFIFFRGVPVSGRTLTVQVDLLAGEYEGTGRKHRTQKVQDVHARKVRGCDLAFEMSEMVKVEGLLPGGGKDSATVRVASVASFLVMKGMAMYDRLKEKDAWDIDYCLRWFPGGADAITEALSPHMSQGLVREGLRKIAAKFASPEHIGPKHVADFDEITDGDERAISQRVAYERVAYLVGELGVEPWDG